MPNQYEPYAMVLNGVFLGMLGIRSDVKDYFGIPEMTPAEEALIHYQGSRKGYKRNIHSNGLDSLTPTRVKTIDRVAVVDRDRSKSVNSRGGKAIKIPTELTSTPATISTAADAPPRTPSIRFTTIKFPGAASNSEISRWLAVKLVTKKPTYFKTSAGQSHRVSAIGNAPVTPPPAPAP